MAAGADANAVSEKGKTPLWEAAAQGNAGTVSVLLAAGAAVHLLSRHADRPPLQAAVRAGIEAALHRECTAQYHDTINAIAAGQHFSKTSTAPTAKAASSHTLVAAANLAAGGSTRLLAMRQTFPRVENMQRSMIRQLLLAAAQQHAATAAQALNDMLQQRYRNHCARWAKKAASRVSCVLLDMWSDLNAEAEALEAQLQAVQQMLVTAVKHQDRKHHGATA